MLWGQRPRCLVTFSDGFGGLGMVPGPWCRWPWRWTAALAGGGHKWACPPLTRCRRAAAEEPAPDDRYHAIYFAMLLAGVGFLLPYNSFITDVDYLHHKFPGGSPQHTPSAIGACPPGTPRAGPGSGESAAFKSPLSCEVLSDLRAVTHLLWAIGPFGA